MESVRTARAGDALQRLRPLRWTALLRLGWTPTVSRSVLRRRSEQPATAGTAFAGLWNQLVLAAPPISGPTAPISTPPHKKIQPTPCLKITSDLKKFLLHKNPPAPWILSPDSLFEY